MTDCDWIASLTLERDAARVRVTELEAEIAKLLALQPCGHPQADVIMGEQVAPGEFTQWCGRCEEIRQAQNEITRRIIHELMELDGAI